LILRGGIPDIVVPIVVDEIIDDTHFRGCRAAHATTNSATGIRLPRLFEMNKRRGTMIWGNAWEFDLGNIIAVGDGTLRRNGVVLPGTSLAAVRRPKIAIFDPVTGNFSVYTLGMATPATLTAAAVGGGTKNMQAGIYSVRVVPARKSTNGYNNASPKAEVTLAAGDRIQITVPAADTANGQDSWRIFASLYTQEGGINGPWYFVQEVAVGAGAGEIPAAGGTFTFEYNDAEISGADLLTYNNDAPVDAEFIGVIGGIPVYVSCQGPGGTSPGPFIVSAKPNNVEAAPLGLAVSASPPDTIIGFYIAQGRLYLMCVNTLQIAMATQTTDPRIPPVVVRPYWRSGFANPDTLLFVNGFLIGMTTHGLARSVAEGDEGSEEFAFATAVEEVLRGISPGHCLLDLDPINNAVCLFHSGHSINSAGYWTTRVWMYGMRENKWIGDILLSSDVGDMIVSGTETINGQLEFLAGGRQQDGSTLVRTYRWDQQGAGVALPYYIAWQFTDMGAETSPKHVGPYFRVVAKQSPGPTAGIHGVEPGEAVPVTTLETGNSGSKSGTITLPAAASVTQEDVIELNIDNLMQFTVRIDGFTDTLGARDRIDEVVLEAHIEGASR
jgi:hypothetical protein